MFCWPLSEPSEDVYTASDIQKHKTSVETAVYSKYRNQLILLNYHLHLYSCKKHSSALILHECERMKNISLWFCRLWMRNIFTFVQKYGLLLFKSNSHKSPASCIIRLCRIREQKSLINEVGLN